MTLQSEYICRYFGTGIFVVQLEYIVVKVDKVNYKINVAVTVKRRQAGRQDSI